MNETQVRTLHAYLGHRPSVAQALVFRPHYRNILRILRFNKDLFFALVKKNKKRFFPHVGGSAAEINARVLAYFDKQKHVEKLGRILSIIEIQTVLVTTYTDIMGVVTQPPVLLPHQSIVRLNYACMMRYAEEILWSRDVAFDTGKEMGRHHISDLVTHVNHLMCEYLRRHPNTSVCYGSYSLHLLNSDVDYGDIDVLQTNARVFLIDLALLLYFITGRHVMLLKVPFLKSYVVLHDEAGRHIIDSFNIRQTTMQNIPKVMVDNIYIIHPTVQLMAMIKMMSQIDRLEELRHRITKLQLRLATLLEYTRFHHCVKFDGKRLQMPMTLNAARRIVTVDTRNYGLGYHEARCYLDEAVLMNDVAKLKADKEVVDFEAVSNSIYLVHKCVMYTYFSNTVLLSTAEGEIHEISTQAIAAHLIMYHLLVQCNYQEVLEALLSSLVIKDKRPIAAVVDRDKKVGTHGIIDIANDVITH
uniref:Poly(A) polymerase catalytic subunit n=1 Tax=Rousettus bat poxvirus TaxID=3141933 RepID=A0AAU7E224_9POXV